jgi:hypothetical protein
LVQGRILARDFTEIPLEVVMRVLAFFLLAVVGVLPFVETRDLHAASEAEVAAARVPLEHYINAHATGNPDYVRKAFFPEAKIMAFRDGKLLNLSVEEFASRFSGKPAADESQRQRRIDSLTITGNAGVARIVLDYPDTTLTDYMSLLKVDGEWKIVNKVFNAQLPGFLIHPLVENAVKHGMTNNSEPLKIRIAARMRDGRLVVEIANTGRLDTRSSQTNGGGTHIGLRNVRERLAKLYPEKSNFTLRQDDKWIRATIEMEV